MSKIEVVVSAVALLELSISGSRISDKSNAGLNFSGSSGGSSISSGDMGC